MTSDPQQRTGRQDGMPAEQTHNEGEDTHRRTYLKRIGTAAAAIAATTSLSSSLQDPGQGGTFAIRERYDRVINVVDAGADPTGRRSVTPILESEVGNDTLFVFPDGLYKLAPVQFSNVTNVGMVPESGATPTLYPDFLANETSEPLLSIVDVNEFRLHNARDASGFRLYPARRVSINLGSVGLQTGDSVDRYLQTYFRDGWEVVLPDGAYTISQAGFDAISGTYSGPTTIRAPSQAVLRHPDDIRRKLVTNCTDGVLHFKNLTFKGRVKADPVGNPDHSRWQFRADRGAAVVFQSIDISDGQYQDIGHANGFIAEQYHAGEAVLLNCHVEGYGDNGAYLSIPHRGGDGAVHVIGGLYKNNNISCVRIGSSNSSVRDVTIVQDWPVPRTPNGLNQRGLRINGGGENIHVENTHITVTSAVPESHGCIQFHRNSVGGEGTLCNVVMKRTTGPVIDNQADSAASYEGRGIDAIGAQSLPEHWTDTCTGSDCRQPRRSPLSVSLRTSEKNSGRTSQGNRSCAPTETAGMSPAVRRTLSGGGRSGPRSELVIESGDGQGTEYTFGVSGKISGRPSGSSDRALGSRASGTVTDGPDVFRYSGAVTTLNISGSATLSIRGI